jgi:hypothetical protein
LHVFNWLAIVICRFLTELYGFDRITTEMPRLRRWALGRNRVAVVGKMKRGVPKVGALRQPWALGQYPRWGIQAADFMLF